jgi:hypothetical protein
VLEPTAKEIVKELFKRNIGKQALINHCQYLKTYENKNNGGCPGCGTLKYYSARGPESHCQLCGYYPKLDDQAKFINRMGKRLGVYFYEIIQEEEIERIYSAG